MSMKEETHGEAFARGQKEGRTDALLAEHSEHLAKINGSIERAAIAEEKLEIAIRELDSRTTTGLDTFAKEVKDAIRAVASDVRTLNEDARLRDERVKVAAATLATETERRREELAVASTQGEQRFTRRQQLAALTLTVMALVSTIVGLYLATR